MVEMNILCKYEGCEGGGDGALSGHSKRTGPGRVYRAGFSGERSHLSDFAPSLLSSLWCFAAMRL